jgi:Mrp family chromosome partitioning ATPase
MFTSPGDGQDTAAVLARLAPVLAAEVAGGLLVVDADFLCPRLAIQFGLDATPSLADVVDGKAAWSEAVRPTGVPRLQILPGGMAHETGAPDPATGTVLADLSPADLGRLLRELAQHYALVLVGAASLAHPEVAPLAGSCDGAYLVVRLSQASRRAVRESARVIRRCRGHLLGCVAVEAS